MGKVFINDEIFTSDADYIIGGFVTEQIDGFTLVDFESNLSDRITKLIEDYLESATIYNLELGFKEPEEKAKQDLSLVLKDNLEIELPYTDNDTILESILYTEQIQSWVLKIKKNIKDYALSTSSKYDGIPNLANEMNLSSMDYVNAKYFTEESTLESFVEQVSIIEL